MQRFIDAIKSAVQQKNWYAGLTLALTLPDICGRLENPQMGSEARFVAWWDKYLLSKYSTRGVVFLSAGDAYALRCALLHEGTGEVLNQRARVALDKFHFIAPPPNQNVIHCNQSNNALQLQTDIFCRDICNGVAQWAKDTEANQDIKSRIGYLLVIHDSSQGAKF